MGVSCIDPSRRCPNSGCAEVPEYRCSDGVCFGEVMCCAGCILAAHAQHPTHFIEKWNGKFFKRTRTGLRDLGLRIQLGHPPGVVCPSRKPAANDFVLYSLTGVHELTVDFCGCPGWPERRMQLMRICWWPATIKEPNTCASYALLKLFQILNCLGKLSAYDFVRGLEMTTNHDGLDRPPDRRKLFMHIMRQWWQVKGLKRFKRGHEEGGWHATTQGELALPCHACPQLGWNLPEDWEQIPVFYRYLYFLFLVQDANFCLTNRNVSSEDADPILGDGFGFFAKCEGEDGYKAHIAKNAGEQEISSCSGFQAMFLANTKQVKGLRTMGIAGVTCSRHNMWRVNGMGDLQVGERYCNLDYLVVSALLGFLMWYLVISYDIACQYSKKFWECMENLPEHLHLKIAKDRVWWKVPNFHLPPHKTPCHSPYSFHYMFGAGTTHSEGVEQNWSFSNGIAASTKLMGLGSRFATLKDVFGFHNYNHRVLPKRLAVSIQEGAKHKVALDAFTEGLEATWLEEVAEWREWVARWEAKQHTDPSESPFEYKESGTSVGGVMGCKTDARGYAYLFMGSEYELTVITRRRLEIDIKALQHASATQKLGFMKRRTALLKRIHKFRQLQRVYMPALRGFLSDHERQVVDGNGVQPPETTRLFMPSEIANTGDRRNVCAVGLGEVEARMREGEAMEALEVVRQGLRSRTLMNRFRIKNYTGQGALTRGQGILRQINIKIHLAKVHYRYARAALLILRGHGVWEEKLRVLREEDVCALNERALREEEAAQQEQLDDLARTLARPAGVVVAEGLAAGEGSHMLSWIWYTVGMSMDEDDPKLHEALQVEWCKAYARTRRFKEEIRLGREEMGRTIEYGHTAADKWDIHVVAKLLGVEPELTEGQWAYAAEKADREHETCAFLMKNWVGIRAKVNAYLGGTAPVEGEEVTIRLDMGDELEPEEEEALLEGED
ncbi:hypothetical protein B0H13DRAFT_1600492 [Mycena leptocephala]|nr:hypothetical protein B0H13DRAFT_1600492 [Mycena leptocephala]